jgi:transcriptional regulator with XRE-family HTH domain
MNPISSLIRYHRRAADLSQAELSALAGVSRKVVQSLEAGNTKVSWENVNAVLKTLNISLEPIGPLVDRWRKSKSSSSESTPIDSAP